MPELYFDADDVESVGYDPLPVGTYSVAIVGVELKDNKAGTGENLNISYEVISGEHTGRRVFETLCIKHEKEKTERIALGKLKEICEAIGKARIRSTEELEGATLSIDVRIEDSGDYGLQNKVKKHSALSGAAPAAAPKAAPQSAPAPQVAAAPQAAPAGRPSTPAWRRNK